MSFNCTLKGEEPLSFNRVETYLIRSLKEYTWHFNMISGSIGNYFIKINLLGFNNFRISNK